jgi:biopolymer transport protein ExbD
MAEIIAKGKRKQIHLDLTPMVDLGFLLITFFVLTTALNKPTTMELAMPSDKPAFPPSNVAESCTINIIPCKKGYYYYVGSSVLNLKFTDNIVAIRAQLIQLKADVNAKKQIGKLAASSEPFVYIKPSTSSTYGQCVAILDELQINQINLYAMTAASTDEEQKVSTNL